MRKRTITVSIALAIAAIVVICMPNSSMAFKPKAGLYYVQAYDGVKFHTYTTPIKFGASASVVIETPNSLILQDVHQNKPNNLDLKALIASINKPLKRIYISHDHEHHWIGLEDFEGVPVYANTATIKSIKEKGADLLAKAKKKFGVEKLPYKKVIIPDNEIKPGEEAIDGIRFACSTPLIKLTGPVNFMEFPDQKVLIHHHLAYNGVHVPIPPIGPRMEALKQLQDDSYDYLIGGHGIPSRSQEFFNAALGYYAKLGEVIKSSPDPETAKEKMVQAYPTWGGVFLLDAILPAHYKK